MITRIGYRSVRAPKLFAVLCAAIGISFSVGRAVGCTTTNVAYNFGPDLLGITLIIDDLVSINAGSCDTTITGYTWTPVTKTILPSTPTPPAQIGYYGAGFTLSSQQLNPDLANDYPLALPNPQNSPVSSGDVALTFNSGNAPITFSPTLTYQTSGKIPAPAAQPSPEPSSFTPTNGAFTIAFGTPLPGITPTPSAGAYFEIAGGSLSGTAKYSAPYVSPSPKPANDPATNPLPPSWITGICTGPDGIFTESITNELTTLYTGAASWTDACTAKNKPWTCCSGPQKSTGTCSAWNVACTAGAPSPSPWSCCTGPGTGTCGPATSNLFSLIAADESSYKQFSTTYYTGQEINANGLDGGLWPYESLPSPSGRYIGLMQDALRKVNGNTFDTPMDSAWNWVSNANIALEIFTQKIGYVFEAVQTAEKDDGISAPTQSQIEDMAMWQYSSNVGSTHLTNYKYQYWVPSPTASPSPGWTWALNTTVDQGAQGNNYPAMVRGEQIPAPSCT